MVDTIYPVKKQNLYLVAAGLFLFSILFEFLGPLFLMIQYKYTSKSFLLSLILFLIGALATCLAAYCAFFAVSVKSTR